MPIGFRDLLQLTCRRIVGVLRRALCVGDGCDLVVSCVDEGLRPADIVVQAEPLAITVVRELLTAATIRVADDLTETVVFKVAGLAGRIRGADLTSVRVVFEFLSVPQRIDDPRDASSGAVFVASRRAGWHR